MINFRLTEEIYFRERSSWHARSCWRSLFASVDRPAQAQGVQTVLYARGRVFPDVGRGAAAIERDAAGHYYVLAVPASVIWIYSADGTTHRANSQRQAAQTQPIKYAVDFDRDAASGRIFVADRGANAVKIFTADGALEASVPVNAPMSVVALANGEFAVVTLRSDHLVRVMNEHGKLLRSFGNISDAVSDPSQLTVPAISASADTAAWLCRWLFDERAAGLRHGYRKALQRRAGRDLFRVHFAERSQIQKIRSLRLCRLRSGSFRQGIDSGYQSR